MFMVDFLFVSVRSKGIVSVHICGPVVRTVRSPDPALSPTLSVQ